MQRSLSLAFVAVLSGIASGDVMVFTSNSCTGVVPAAGAVAVTNVGGKYRVELSDVATGNYFVCSDPGDVVEWIRCDPAAFNVNLSTVTNRPISVVEEISTTGTSFFGFRLSDVQIGERLGPSTLTTQSLVRVNSITSLEDPTATITCAIEMRSSSAAPGTIRFPQATLRTDIRNAFDGFDTLEFKNIEGTPADPVDIVTAGTLRKLVVGSPDATAMAPSMPTPPDPVLAALGFSSAEAFQSYVDTLSDAELKVYLVLVLQVAQSLEAPTP